MKKKALKRHGSPEAITTDGLRSYRAVMKELGNANKQEVGRWANNRVENSHLPFRRRERAMRTFRRMKTLQKFASVHANVHNHYDCSVPFAAHRIHYHAAVADQGTLIVGAIHGVSTSRRHASVCLDYEKTSHARYRAHNPRMGATNSKKPPPFRAAAQRSQWEGTFRRT